MIDENGKLFGKVNLIDLIIVLLIAALLVFVALKVVDHRNNAPVLSQVEISFFGDEVPDYVTEFIHEGDSVLDSTSNVTMGTVKSTSFGDPISYMLDIDENVRPVVKEGYKSVELTITTSAELTDNGVKIDGTLYGVGHTLAIYAGRAKMWVKVSGITPVA